MSKLLPFEMLCTITPRETTLVEVTDNVIEYIPFVRFNLAHQILSNKSGSIMSLLSMSRVIFKPRRSEFHAEYCRLSIAHLNSHLPPTVGEDRLTIDLQIRGA